MDYERESVKSKRSYRYVVVLSFNFELIQIPIIYLHLRHSLLLSCCRMWTFPGSQLISIQETI
jgi:hypothetical protein